jgi:hypothetical protein
VCEELSKAFEPCLENPSVENVQSETSSFRLSSVLSLKENNGLCSFVDDGRERERIVTPSGKAQKILRVGGPTVFSHRKLWLSHQLKIPQLQNQFHCESTSTQTSLITAATMTSRPTVGIIGADGAATKKTIPLPSVFKAPIRPDIVQYATRPSTPRITRC